MTDYLIVYDNFLEIYESQGYGDSEELAIERTALCYEKDTLTPKKQSIAYIKNLVSTRNTPPGA